jgi:hypothetical protein
MAAGLLVGQTAYKEAKYEALCVLDMLEKLRATNDVEGARRFLERIDRNTRGQDLELITPDDSGDKGELLEMVAT